MLMPVTQFILPDEKAWRLTEVNLVRPPSYQWHRWQVIFVNRADALAEFWTDFGPSSNYTAPEVTIPALWEHSVAELQDIALDKRLGDDYWQKRLGELNDSSTLIPDILAQKEEHWKIIRNQSVFGPSHNHQRNGFSKRTAQESKRA